MKKYLSILLLAFMVTACGPLSLSQPPATLSALQTQTAPTLPATFTPIPTFTSTPAPTAIPLDPPSAVALDFIAQLCSAKWSSGAHYLAACPPTNANRSGGYAMGVDPVAEGLPAGTPALLTVPAWNGDSSLFLRYPRFSVRAGDRFRSTVFCRETIPSCDVQFALEYYDASGKYHSFLAWNQVKGQAPTVIDADLGALANQNVEWVLVLRLFHALNTDQQDNGIWVAPHIFRAG